MKKQISIEVSARHVHLSETHFKKLFGKHAKLGSLAPLSQTGEFASDKHVLLEHKGSRLGPVRIVGPFRDYTQVELAQTDARNLKIDPPLRRSGNLKNSQGVTLKGPHGSVRLQDGVIIQRRHIHASTRDARALGVKDGDRVRVRVGGRRGAVLDEVEVKVRDSFKLRMHLDTDEGNALWITKSSKGEIVK